MRYSKPEPDNRDLNIIVVPGRVFVEEKEAEYKKMREDVDKGLEPRSQ